jgi:DNA-binding transcriptional regulator YdaS (Cro superfamily)
MVRTDSDKKQLARALSLSEKSVNNKISGATAFTVPEAKAIMQLLPGSCSFDYIFMADSDARAS